MQMFIEVNIFKAVTGSMSSHGESSQHSSNNALQTVLTTHQCMPNS